MAEQQQAPGAAPQTTEEVGDFKNLLAKELNAKTKERRSEVDGAIDTLVKEALAGTPLTSNDTVENIRSIIAGIDKQLGAQMNEILHNPAFQQLEGSWRGLHYLVNNSETDQMLQIRVMNITKEELGKTLGKFRGVIWDQSPLFKKLYQDEYGTLGGNPYGCLVGDYYFDHTAPDMTILEEMSKVAAAAHAPFIAASAPSLFGMESWQELLKPRDVNGIFSTPGYEQWRSFRDSEDSRYVGLTMPRFLARRPYGAKSNPVEAFDFEEETSGTLPQKYTWANAAYAMAANINRSYKMYGWCSRIRGVESGGGVQGLPTHTFATADGGLDSTCPTEISIPDTRELELANGGFMPLIHRKNSDFAAFISAQSVQKPKEWSDPDATANSKLSARLPYLFPVCRFAHYLKCIVRDKIGGFNEREDMQRYLENWILQYVEGDPEHATETDKARKPLAAAQVVVEPVEGDPGYYTSKFFLRPHYQLEGLTVSLRLVSKLPSQKAG
ncbi:MAG TPA: type VI secretion system contractile sheath large subunit [Polyangiaceae bacterium]|nr:type VI secretion system contractile sheath large subunit [Polyangiaceae bacterium]